MTISSQGNKRNEAIILFAALLISTSAHAQAEKPFKLIITWYDSGIVAINYPSKERCEAGALAVYKRVSSKQVESGLPPEATDTAFCIPA